MPSFDYAAVSREDLELIREPRKSQFTVVHKPTGSTASDPVVPGSLTPARFRRPTNMPKENRVKDMEGYIEGTDEQSKELFIILKDGSKNEYLDALAKDPEALRVSFEGGGGSVPGATPAAPATEAPAETAPAAEEPAPVAQSAPAEAPTEAPAETTTANGENPVNADLDDLLAELDSA